MREDVHRFFAVSGGANRLDAVDELEELAEPFAHDRVVVDDQNSDVHVRCEGIGGRQGT